MADLGKNGFEHSGYTEPFFVPVGVTLAASQISTQNMGVTGFVGAVPIEYTVDKNAGLYVRALGTVTGTIFTSKDVNFDTRMEFTSERYIINVGGTNASVETIVYDNVSETYTITVSDSITTVGGKVYAVIAKHVDVGTVSASVIYTAGQKVVEPYPVIA